MNHRPSLSTTVAIAAVIVATDAIRVASGSIRTLSGLLTTAKMRKREHRLRSTQRAR